MLNKTFDKLLKKEVSKPLHFIDTSVFLESILDTRAGVICKAHLNNMGKGKYFRAVLSVSVLGEISLIIFRDMSDKKERLEIFDALERFISIRNVDLMVQKKNDYSLVHEIMNIESRLDELDTEHLVCAKRAGADVFITLDEKLIGNSVLESKLGLLIKHPNEFVNI